MRFRLALAGAALGAAVPVVATTPPAGAVASRMNVVSVMVDDMSAVDGGITRMPFLSTLPGMQWFDRAYAPVPLCCPARATYFTGQESSHTGVENVYGPYGGVAFDDRRTLATALSGAGYATALFGKYLNEYGTKFHLKADRPPGWGEWLAFAGNPGYGIGSNGYTLTNGAIKTRYAATTSGASYSTDVLGRAAATWVRAQASAGRPFFAQFNPYAPHLPHLPAPRYRGVYGRAPVRHDTSWNEADVSDKPAFIRSHTVDTATWDAETRQKWETLRSVDDWVRNIWQAVVDAGQADNTALIFLSDNGFADGQHRWRHKKCEYEACTRIPLGIRIPGQRGGHHGGAVTTTDVAPTIETLTGAPADRPEDGVSFAPTLLGGPEPARDAFYGHWIGQGAVGGSNPPGWDGITTDHAHYIELLTGEREFYDLDLDPFELSNRVDDPAYAGTVADLATRLHAHEALYPHPRGSMTGALGSEE
jgi:arylsulfatase A-like enzyme